MINEFIATIRQFSLDYGPIGIFIAAILEQVIAIIPSALVLMAAGVFLLEGVIFSIGGLGSLFFIIVVPAALGTTIGSLFVYGLVYWGGKPIILRWGRFLGITWQEIERVEKKFTKGRGDAWLLFGLRAMPIIPGTAINIVCGLVRLELKKYMVFTFLGTLVRAFILSFIGWQVGNLYQIIAQHIAQAEKIVLVVGLAVFSAFIFYKRAKKRKN